MSIFQYFNYSKSEDLNNKWPPPLNVHEITLGENLKKFEICFLKLNTLNLFYKERL